MPCQSDYLSASGQELESQRVCQYLVYLYGRLEIETPKWIAKAAVEYYGNLGRLDEATSLLCDCCRRLSSEEKEKFIYDAYNSTSRVLASWWEKHQEWDRRRVREENGTRRRIIAKERALKKLTVDEMTALGLDG